MFFLQVSTEETLQITISETCTTIFAKDKYTDNFNLVAFSFLFHINKYYEKKALVAAPPS